ncbi:glycosyltransferase family 4 protein [soil metagenome]
MRILMSLTYYRPHISGLTIYVERLSRELAARGHFITVLTSQHDSSLPREEWLDGVRIVRCPVTVTLRKGPIMPRFAAIAARLVQQHDLVSVHLPQAESVLVVGAAKALRKPSVLTYHCDLELSAGSLNSILNRAVATTGRVTGRLVDAVVAYTEDYASHSAFLQEYVQKLRVIPPPVTIGNPSDSEIQGFRNRYAVSPGPVLGFASRLATEKGIEFAIDALPGLIEQYPRLQVLFAGPYLDVVGEQHYWRRLEPVIRELGDRWRFLGTLSQEELPAFYGSLDLLLMTSINSTESFGLVQVESMLCGTPVVATDLPGVRQPVRMTGMGEVVGIADKDSLAGGIRKILANRDQYVIARHEIEQIFSLRQTVDSYENLYQSLISRKGRQP